MIVTVNLPLMIIVTYLSVIVIRIITVERIVNNSSNTINSSSNGNDNYNELSLMCAFQQSISSRLLRITWW